MSATSSRRKAWAASLAGTTQYSRRGLRFIFNLLKPSSRHANLLLARKGRAAPFLRLYTAAAELRFAGGEAQEPWPAPASRIRYASAGFASRVSGACSWI